MTSASLCWSAAMALEDAPGGHELSPLPDPLPSVEQPTSVIAAANAVGTRAVRRVLSFIDDISSGVRVGRRSGGTCSAGLVEPYEPLRRTESSTRDSEARRSCA